MSPKEATLMPTMSRNGRFSEDAEQLMQGFFITGIAAYQAICAHIRGSESTLGKSKKLESVKLIVNHAKFSTFI